MANELRVRQNFLGGLIEDNPLTLSATSMQSAALAAAVAIGTTQHMPIILDPDGLYGEPEIAYVTAHTASATTATLLRGQEGTTARQHQQDVRWTHGPSTIDMSGLYGSYTPTWTASGGTAPSYGNATVTARYHLQGRLLTVTVSVLWGSTTSGGSGGQNYWLFSLPFGLVAAQDGPAGRVWIDDFGTGYRHGTVKVESGNAVLYITDTSGLTSTNGRLSATLPQTWATSDTLNYQFTTEVNV